MTIPHTDLDREITLELRSSKLKFFHQNKFSLREFICVPPSTDTDDATATMPFPSDDEFLFCLLQCVNDMFLENEDLPNFKCHAGLHHAVQDYLDSYELLYRKASNADTSTCKSKFYGDHRTLYALFRHKPDGKSSYYRHTFFSSIYEDIITYSGNPRSDACCRDGRLKIVFDLEKLFFGTNLVGCLKDGDFELSAATVETSFQHGRQCDVPAEFRALSISADLSQDPSHITMDIEEPSPSATTNFFATPIVDVDDLDIDDAADGNNRTTSLSHKSSTKKRDSLPGTQFKKRSLLVTSKPLPGCKANESERYKKDNHCSRESFADLDLYGVEDAGERWRILTTIGHTKLDASHKRNSVPTTQRVKHLLFTLYNYCKTAAARGIYVPYPHLISVDSVMGSEYVSCALPDSIYDKHFAMDTALLKDLRHLFKLNPQISTMLLQHTSGFNAYHGILIQCCQVYRPAPPRSSLCLFDSDKISVATYALNIIEYNLECTVAKQNTLSFYDQFLRFVEGFPNQARACLLNHAERLFTRDPRFDRKNNIPLQLFPDQWALFANTNLNRDGISLRPKSFPSKQLNISAIQKGKPRSFICHACGSNEHLWASCPHVEIKVTDPTAKKRLLDVIPKCNIRSLSTGEDTLSDPTNDDSTAVIDNTSATDDNIGQDSSENNDSFEDEFLNADTAFESVLDEGIITSVGQEYFDDEYDGTIGAEFLGDIPCHSAFVATSIPFREVFPDAQLESGEDAVSSVPICQHCRSDGHFVDNCPLLSIDPQYVQCSSIDASNIMSLQGTVQSSSLASMLPSGCDISSGFSAKLPTTITVTTADSFDSLDDESVIQILHVSRFASKHPSSELASSVISAIGMDVASFRNSSSELQSILHPCTPFALLNAVYSSSALRSVYQPHIGTADESESMSILALKLVKICKDAASHE
ncbi:predicted protein [Chaetoceros tenuissimus]|uniref:CCHC-type domain-containing protein n=1 Tax=Chaetoceros tenuissimus TaxID=426638 RepID=A0AAD3D3I4_9STRA|nr:predicted protein [Chaetoceros tenuissimus]